MYTGTYIVSRHTLYVITPSKIQRTVFAGVCAANCRWCNPVGTRDREQVRRAPVGVGDGLTLRCEQHRLAVELHGDGRDDGRWTGDGERHEVQAKLANVGAGLRMRIEVVYKASNLTK